MVWDDLLKALGLMLVIEGLLPFLSPARFRRTLIAYAAVDNRWMRGVGLASMLIGLLVLKAVN